MPRLKKKVLPALTSEELRRLLDACRHKRDEAMILFMVDSGVRTSDLGVGLIPSGSTNLRIAAFPHMTGSLRSPSRILAELYEYAIACAA